MQCYELTISNLRDRFKNNQINLDPPYQRKPAWKAKQRLLLLSSLFNGIPIPALIFHKRFNTKSKKEVYDVLDGKQRVETILHFIEQIEISGEDALWVEFINPNTEKKDYLFYADLKSRKVNKEYGSILEKFWSYKMPIIEYEGDLYDFFGRNVSSKEVFVRINSTGSSLKKHEIRHAKYAGLFFELGNELERRYSNLFVNVWKVNSRSDLDRYLFHEFLLELCTAVHFGSYTDRRKKLDVLLSGYQWTQKEVNSVKSSFVKIVNWIKDIFPDGSLRVTRFKNKSDFYSLFVVLLSLLNRNYVTSDRKSNRTLGKFLLSVSKQVQKLDPEIKAYKTPRLSSSEQKLLQYVISTRQATDSLKNREFRHKFLMESVKDGFILRKKDSKRTFDSNVKGLLWTELLERYKKPKCPNPFNNPKCKKYLSAEDAEVDHLHPWSKGGVTKLENARLICSSCNSSKGAKF